MWHQMRLVGTGSCQTRPRSLLLVSLPARVPGTDASPSSQARPAFALKGAQSDGDLPPNDWGDEKAHTRDPTPTTIDPNDPKSKQTHIPQGESFAEYLARRNGGGGTAAPVAAKAAPTPSYSAPAASYSAPAATNSWSGGAPQRSSPVTYEMGKGYNPASRGGPAGNSGYQPVQGYQPAAAAAAEDKPLSRNDAAAGMFQDYMAKRGGGAAATPAPAEDAAPLSRNDAAAGMFEAYMAGRK